MHSLKICYFLTVCHGTITYLPRFNADLSILLCGFVMIYYLIPLHWIWFIFACYSIEHYREHPYRNSFHKAKVCLRSNFLLEIHQWL